MPLRLGEALVASAWRSSGSSGASRVVERRPLEAAWARRPRAADRAARARRHRHRYLNVNADDVAAAVAAALGADELVFLSDVPGVLAADGSVIAEISASAPPAVTGGMLPKLAACGTAVAAGVGRVRIGAGTVVTP